MRLQIESALAHRILSALTPAPQMVRPVASTGVPALDQLLEGGLPIGAITEISGLECSGRSTLACSFIARRTREGKVCAWVDASDALTPEAAAASQVDLSRLLWVRCGAVAETHGPAKISFQLPQECLIPPPTKRGLYAGGWGGHPRDEAKGIADAMGPLLQVPRPEPKRQGEQMPLAFNVQAPRASERTAQSAKPWTPLDQALRVTDLLLQGGGFNAIVLDMGSVTPEYSSRVPLATWFRYRAAAERTQSSILLLSQRPCAKSSAGLVLRLGSAGYSHEAKVFTGLQFDLEVERQRFAPTSNVVPLRKGPQRETGTRWDIRCSWAGCR
jgi:recombination protein RecA